MSNRRRTLSLLMSSCLSLASYTNAYGQTHKGMTFQGVIKLPSGELPTRSGLTINARILSPTDCILREEQYSGVSLNNGYINLTIGQGTVGGYDPGLSVSQIMDNSATINSLTCLNLDGSVNAGVNSFVPAVQNARKLRISLTIDSTPVVADFNMRATPFAVNSETLNGKVDTSFVNVNNAQSVTQANVESIFNRFTKLDSILNNFNGTGTSLGANITGNAATATTAGNVTGTVAIANGGTGATSVGAARTNLGLGTLATLSPTGIADATTYLRGDGTWQAVSGAVSSVAGKSGAVSLVAADISDFSTAADARITAQKGVASGLASLDGSGKVPSTQLALSATDIPNLDAAKITTGTFADSMLAGLSIDKLLNGATKYFNYKPNAVACADNEVLKYDSTLNASAGGWKCAADTGAGAETDPTVQAFSKNAPSTGLTVNGTNQLTVTYGTGAGTAAEGNDARITGALQSATAFSGDVSGTYNATSVDKIKGKTVSAAPTSAGQVLRYDGVNLVPNFISMFDLRSTVTGAQAFGGVGCTAGQTLTWTAALDNLACSAIAITHTQVSGLVASDISDFSTAADARITAQKGVASGLASLDGSGKVPSTQLALSATDIPNLDAAKITTGTFADSMLVGLSIDKLINGATKYLNYKPNNVACADTEVLKYDSTLNTGVGGWKCATDSAGGAETDPTVQTFAKNAPSTGLTVNGTNQLTVTYGTAAGTAAEGNDVRITGALQSATAFSGDVSGTYNATSVDKIKGKTVSAAPTSAGQVLRYDGVNLVPNFISMFDLRSTVTGAQAFGGVGCTAGQTLTWTAALDNLACSAIAITSGQVSGLVASATSDTTNAANITSGSLPAARMPALTGDVTTAAGTVSTTIANAAVTTAKIADGAVTAVKLGTDVGVWSTDGTNVYRSSGKVGIGTTAPIADIETVSTSVATPRGIYSTQYSADNEPAVFGTRKARGTASIPTAVVNGDNISAFGASAYDGSAFQVPGYMGFVVNGAVAAGSIPTDFFIRTGAAGNGTERFRIDSVGNVGIGKTPVTKLDVNGTVGVGASVEAAAVAVNSGTAYTIPDNSVNIRRITLTGNATITLPSFTTPTATVWTLTVTVTQDATGSRTLAWTPPAGDTILWDSSASAPAPATAATKTTIYQFTKPSDSTIWYSSMVWKQN